MSGSPFADVVLVADRVLTMGEGDLRPATTVAVRGGRVVAVGGSEVVEGFRGGRTRLEHFPGATITPGLIDAHTHPLLGVHRARGVDLGEVHDLGTLLRLVGASAAAAGPTDWVLGWNLGYDVFGGRPLETSRLEPVLGGRPMLLLLFDGHTALASRLALRMTDTRLSGADSGTFVTDERGGFTGEVREESAIAAVLAATPALEDAEVAVLAARVLRDMAALGYTGACLMDGDRSALAMLDRIEAGGDLPVRVVSALQHDPEFGPDRVADHLELREARGRRWRGGLIKMYADGVIDTGTGWLSEQDTHHEGLRGLWSDAAAFHRTVSTYARAGFQIATHAIGDAAVAATLDAYEGAGTPPSADAPHRIEHLELLADRDLQRMSRTGVVASMQPSHMQWRRADGSDSWASRVGADRTERAWRVGDLLGAGVRVALGSDWPVAGFDPREIMAWARSRRTPGDLEAPVFEPGQVVTAWQALAGLTVHAAAAQGDQDLGVLEPGRRADLTVWAADPVQVGPDDLLTVPVSATFVSGEATFRAGA